DMGAPPPCGVNIRPLSCVSSIPICPGLQPVSVPVAYIVLWPRTAASPRDGSNKAPTSISVRIRFITYPLEVLNESNGMRSLQLGSLSVKRRFAGSYSGNAQDHH